MRLGVGFLLMLVAVGPGWAQAPRPCTVTESVDGPGDTTVTATIPAGNPSVGPFFYLCSVLITMAAVAPVPAAPGPNPICTSSGFTKPLIWWGDVGVMNQGAQRVVVSRDWALGLRTAKPETPFSVSCVGGHANHRIRINITGYYAL